MLVSLFLVVWLCVCMERGEGVCVDVYVGVCVCERLHLCLFMCGLAAYIPNAVPSQLYFTFSSTKCPLIRFTCVFTVMLTGLRLIRRSREMFPESTEMLLPQISSLYTSHFSLSVSLLLFYHCLYFSVLDLSGQQLALLWVFWTRSLWLLPPRFQCFTCSTCC